MDPDAVSDQTEPPDDLGIGGSGGDFIASGGAGSPGYNGGDVIFRPGPGNGTGNGGNVIWELGLADKQGANGKLLIRRPGHKDVTFERYVAEQVEAAIGSIVGPRLLGILADWLAEDGRDAEAAGIRELAGRQS